MPKYYSIERAKIQNSKMAALKDPTLIFFSVL